MSAAFVAQLRSRRPPIEVAPDGPDSVSFRVQAEELWDAVNVTARPDTPVRDVKRRAVAAFYPEHEYFDDFVLKLRGWEILDERAGLAESGVAPGSIILLSHRRRRPVR